jgi:hypothetical protein
VLNRIAYIYNLKSLVEKGVWKGFTNKKFDLPLVYYTDNACFIANPTEKFIASYRPTLVFENKDVKIFKTKLLDSVPFHMETSVTLGATSSAYNHRSPFMHCSSFEISRKYVPDLNSTEQWATLVIHEYFHGFQFMHPADLTYFEQHIAVSSDTLKNIYNKHRWFRESVDKENRLLLNALDAPNKSRVGVLLDSFFVLRENRRKVARQQLNADIVAIEQCYETREGTARYAEYSLYDKFAKKYPDKKLLETDSSYHSYQYFHHYSMEKDQWLYLSEKTNYFYATGFNMVRLLNKLNIPYKSRLFNEGGLSLEQILLQHLPAITGRRTNAHPLTLALTLASLKAWPVQWTVNRK